MIGAIILGLLAGFIGKALLPGKDPGGFFMTILIGLAGSLIGFFIFTELLGIGDSEAFDLGGLPGAIIGTMILLFAYRKLVGEREEPRGQGLRRSLGELLVCPYCLAQWIVGAYAVGLVAAPRLTRLVAAMYTAQSISDFLQLAYLAAEKRAPA